MIYTFLELMILNWIDNTPSESLRLRYFGHRRLTLELTRPADNNIQLKSQHPMLMKGKLRRVGFNEELWRSAFFPPRRTIDDFTLSPES